MKSKGKESGKESNKIKILSLKMTYNQKRESLVCVNYIHPCGKYVIFQGKNSQYLLTTFDYFNSVF